MLRKKSLHPEKSNVSTNQTTCINKFKSDKFKKFVVDLLEKLVESTDNELDDRALQIVKKGLDIE